MHNVHLLVDVAKKRVPKLGVNQLRVYEMNKYGKLANNAVLRWLLVKSDSNKVPVIVFITLNASLVNVVKNYLPN